MASTGRPALALVCLATITAAAVPALADEVRPALVGFHAANPPPAVAAAVRAALAGAAEVRGAAFLDLTPAPPPPAEAPRHLARAIEAYHQVAFRDALVSADAGLAAASSTGARDLQPAQLGELFLYRALAATELGDGARAWDDFVRAATVDPTRVLDQARFAPRVIESFARAAEQVAALPRVAISIEAGAACGRWLDGRPVVESGLAVVRGEHVARIECPAHEPWGATVAITADGQRIRPALVERAAPTPAALAALAAERGLAGAVLARLAPAAGSALLVLEQVDRRGRVIRRVTAALRGDDAARDTRAAFDRLLADAPAVAVVVDRRWFHRPWVWGAIGAAAATAVLLPIMLSGDETPSGFDVSVGTEP